ncbi:hypothetical protein GOB57_24745 [Sinorhizobium meliloti]|nr:hypothetical protein [Sinorhizobium meliloti]
MSAFTSKELAEHGDLNSDGMAGFEAQIAIKTHKREVVWPAHLIGKRVDAFRHGSEVARAWMAMRRGVGTARRQIRQRELKEIGIMTVLRADSAADHKAEQIKFLQEAVKTIKRIKMLPDEASAPVTRVPSP